MFDIPSHSIAVSLDVDEDNIGGWNSPEARISFKRFFLLSSPATNSTRCSTVSTASPTLPIVTIAGRRRYFLAIFSTADGIVAVYIIVCRYRSLPPRCLPHRFSIFSSFRVRLFVSNWKCIKDLVDRFLETRSIIRSASSMMT